LKDLKEMKFLIIDDMPNMIKTIRNMLRHLGYQHTAEAEDGISAWKVLKNEQIDFVISDWNMPNMAGIELLHKIRRDENLKEMPFLMVTAEVAEELVAKAAETDVDGYIIKPFIAKTLDERIHIIMEKRSSPSEVDTYLKAGNVYLNSGMLDNALKEYEKAMKINQDNPRVHWAVGNVGGAGQGREGL